MSADTPTTKGHRQTRSVAMAGIAASSQNPRNPHHLNQHAHARNGQSEMNNYNSDQSQPPSTPPRTPRRDNQHSSQTLYNSAASGTGSKQKSRNKNRPKALATSPITTRNERNISPYTGAQSAGIPSSAKPMNTPSTAAYAGPTFHASPAPSALPIPSFYSKSVPESPGAKGLKSLRGGPLATPPHAPPPTNQFQREESPLDIFFRADREEKARAHSATETATAAGPFQPPIDSSRNAQTPPASSNRSQNRQGSANRLSSGGIFAMELDGEREAGTPFGPAFSTPYSERINAARVNQQNRLLQQQHPAAQKPFDKAEALKAYLFSGTVPLSTHEESLGSSSPSHSATNSYQTPSTLPKTAGPPQGPHYGGHQYGHEFKHQNNNPRGPGRSSGLRQEVTPTKTPTRNYDLPGTYPNSPTPLYTNGNISLASRPQVNDNITNGTSSAPHGVSSGQRSADLQGMEDSLRKILKLDSAGGSGTAIGNQPKASVSVPNYVGGRPPPMNGLHNGVLGS